MKKKIMMVGVGMVASGAAWANNGDQMVGLSGISNAMGGAVVATPQDITTALSNPAGLAFLDLGETKTRFDMNLGILNPSRELNGVESDGDAYVMATGGFAFKSDLVGDGVTIGVGAYPISGGGVDFPTGAFRMGASQFSVVANRQALRIGPGVAFRINDDLAIGANISLATNSMSFKAFDRTPTMPPQIVEKNFPQDVAYGAAGALGVVYKANDRMQLGANYTSKSYSEDLEWNLSDGKYTLEFEDPQTVAAGLSYRITDALQVEADVKWIDYSDVRSANVLRGPTPDKDRIISYGWDDQWVYGLGVRYDMANGISLMAGYNYGESPIDEGDINNNVGVTAIVEHHLSAGVSARVTKYSTLTFSLMHGFENEMEANTLLPGQTSPTKVSFETNMYTLQFTYRH